VSEATAQALRAPDRRCRDEGRGGGAHEPRPAAGLKAPARTAPATPPVPTVPTDPTDPTDPPTLDRRSTLGPTALCRPDPTPATSRSASRGPLPQPVGAKKRIEASMLRTSARLWFVGFWALKKTWML
jgi:hypothetical protein